VSSPGSGILEQGGESQAYGGPGLHGISQRYELEQAQSVANSERKGRINKKAMRVHNVHVAVK
jgi:hypothetical protein